MENHEHLQALIAELNTQIVALMKRKDQIMQKFEGNDSADSYDLSSGAYAKYLQMIQTKRTPVENPRVVYQGEPGAYSEIACRNFFGKEVAATGLLRFEDTFLALANGQADYAVLPIENSSTGAIRQVYDLLETYNYFFVGETTVHINHALMALPGTTLDDIDTVFSHEQGLFQCEKFLALHPEWKTIAQADTAGSAKMVSELKDPHKAAICSTLAAELYHLNILLEKVNTNSNNTTRFVVVSPHAEMRDNRDKVCISLNTGHKSGALHDILGIFAAHGINLVRLESRPIPNRNWEYMFFIEFTGDLLTKKIDAIIHELSLMSEDLRVLGNFHSNI